MKAVLRLGTHIYHILFIDPLFLDSHFLVQMLSNNDVIPNVLQDILGRHIQS